MTKFKIGNKIPLFRIQLKDRAAAPEIFKVATLLHHMVNIENYNRRPPCDAMLPLSILAPLLRYLPTQFALLLVRWRSSDPTM